MKILLKVVFVSVILAWLVSTGKLDLSLLKQSAAHPHLWAIAIFLLCVQAVIGGYRWRVILKTKSREKLPAIHIIKANWIGLFFSSFLPGIVTGDLFKLLYVRDMDRSLDKTFLVTSTLLDRALGLSGLVVLMGISSAFNYQRLLSLGPEMGTVLLLNALIFVAIAVFLATLLLPETVTATAVRAGKAVPLIGSYFSKSLAHIWTIGHDRGAVLSCLILSIISQFLHIAVFWIITSPFYGKPLGFAWAFSIIPLGDIAVTVPIAPMGLGVGHAVFESLFGYIGIEGGANLFNLYFMAMLTTYLLGIIPYLTMEKRHSLKDAEKIL